MKFDKSMLWNLFAVMLAFGWMMMCDAWEEVGNSFKPAVITVLVTGGLALWLPVISKKKVWISVGVVLGALATLLW